MTQTSTKAALELADEQFDLADKIEAILERATTAGMTPSLIARRARAEYQDAKRVLTYLVEHKYAHTSGNGAWIRYHAGR